MDAYLLAGPVILTGMHLDANVTLWNLLEKNQLQLPHSLACRPALSQDKSGLLYSAICQPFQGLRHKLFPQHPLLLAPVGQPALECSVTTKKDVTWDIIRGAVTTALAIELFLHAEMLSRSQAFRLTTGGCMGVTLVALIACVFLFR